MTKMKIKACLTSNSDNWKTPKYIYDQVKAHGYFDPCPYQSTIDGLSINWKKKNFVNPPYSNLKEWITKSIEESKHGKNVLLLIPARTDTKAFKMLWDYGAVFTFIIGRLKFNDYNNAPFPSMLVKLTGKKSICKIQKREEIILKDSDSEDAS